MRAGNDADCQADVAQRGRWIGSSRLDETRRLSSFTSPFAARGAAGAWGTSVLSRRRRRREAGIGWGCWRHILDDIIFALRFWIGAPSRRWRRFVGRRAIP